MNIMKSAAVAVAAIVSASGASQAQDLRLLSSWDSSYAAVSEVLVPFVEAIVPEINIQQGWVVINPPRGLLDLGK